MTDPLFPAIAVLDDFERKLRQYGLWPTPPPEDHFVHVKLAKSWIYGSVNMLESNEIENWRSPSIPLSDIAKKSAETCIRFWKNNLDLKPSAYGSYGVFKLPPTVENETLIEYLARMAETIAKSGWKHIEERTFKSFLHYVKRFQEESPVLEYLFPKKMDLHYGLIKRNISAESYPIPQELASQILIEFSKRCRAGRKDTRLTALEGLALCSICLTAARLQLPIRFKDLMSMKSVVLQDPTTLILPTLFGAHRVPIAARIAQFLNAVAKIPSKKPREQILQRPVRSLTRLFDEILVSLNPNPAFGNITYLSLMTQPHLFGPHRYQHK